ncbi:MAG TPA: hypothetical protein PLP28_10745 [Flavobacteriales bacterium]|nr:hypothetical protein [Flavobacteriales bacterium]
MGDKPPAQNEEQMVRAILAHYHNVQRQPLRILKYFQHPDVRYAA